MSDVPDTHDDTGDERTCERCGAKFDEQANTTPGGGVVCPECGEAHMKLSADERAAILRFLETLPLGQIANEVKDFEGTLRQLLHATRDQRNAWENDDLEAKYGSSYHFTPEQIDALTDGERRALIADLVDWLYLAYTSGNIAMLVRGLTDITWVGDVFEDPNEFGRSSPAP